MNDGTRQVEIYIRTSPQDLWEAITQPDKTSQYWFRAHNHSTWTPGARWTSESADGEIYLDGEIVEIVAPSRLVHTMHVANGPAAPEKASTVSWDIAPLGDACRLLLVNTDLGPQTLEYTNGGWEIILSGLKTLLETGTPLEIGAAGDM